jgi:hypothetical protein
MFITLSCAEYYWPDISRLLHDRFSFIDKEHNPLGDAYTDGRINTVQNVNDYTIVIQEYFQMRIKNWLKTVGKHVFKIDHYWLRYEFAPSRGQIHVHMLAISKQHNELLQEIADVYGNMANRAEILGKWMQESFGVTGSMNDDPLSKAKVTVELNSEKSEKSESKSKKNDPKTDDLYCMLTSDEEDDNNKGKKKASKSKRKTRSASKKDQKRTTKATKEFNKNHPSNFRYGDKNVQENILYDENQCLFYLQTHKCCEYCMREKRIK